ncbi:MAG: hypothetical protein RMJ07_02130 [Nitrososphaerota archaeon]|nr:hypothetical protein [Nitrososphaerota archaeon]
MTSFEHYFAALKKALGNETLFEIWPDFEPQYDEREYAWAELKGLGETLLLNCGQCEGPSDMRHERCKTCVEKRKEIARESYKKVTGRSMEKWPAIILCRVYTE